MTIGLSTGASAQALCPQAGDRDGAGSRSVPTPGTSAGGARASSSTATAAYVYRKRDAAKPASWTNSTQQYLVATWPGAEYREVTLAQVQAALVSTGLDVCGDDWAVQEDQAHGTEALFRSVGAPSYPTMTIGWPPIFAAQHWNLGAFFDVPACGAPPTTPALPGRAAPTVDVGAATAAAVAPTQSAVPSQSPTVHRAPVRPSVPPVTAAAAIGPTGSPTPRVTPSQLVDSAVLAAPDSTESAAPVVESAVLAAEDSAGSLAQTGAAPGGLAVVAVLLLAAGGALLVLRRRGAMR